jgi:Tol biopolymer transport system component
VVTLKPKPGAGYVLSRWGGANGAQVEKNSDVYQIVMNGNKSLTAVFLYNQIVFTSYRSGNNANIHTLDLNGKTVSGALTTDSKDDRQARFSPDQSLIVFVSDRDNFGDIFIMKADGTEQTKSTNGGSCENPSWTPDGRIVYRYYDGNDYEIYIMNADGSGATALTDNTRLTRIPSALRMGRSPIVTAMLVRIQHPRFG